MREELDTLGMGERRIILVDLLGDGIQSRALNALHEAGVLEGIKDTDASAQPLEKEQREEARIRLQRRHVADKMVLLLNMNYDDVQKLLADSTFVVNRLGRVKNAMLSNGTHIVSPRLTDGGLSLTTGGAVEIHALRKSPMPLSFEREEGGSHLLKGPAWVVVNDDAEPFVRQGRNVFHGFILACDSWISPGDTCLIVNEKGELLGHGIAQGTLADMQHFQKGVAVKTRGGINL
jgi:archaeosine-15-forming tRNA-guanine transglycosylase